MAPRPKGAPLKGVPGTLLALWRRRSLVVELHAKPYRHGVAYPVAQRQAAPSWWPPQMRSEEVDHGRVAAGTRAGRPPCARVHAAGGGCRGVERCWRDRGVEHPTRGQDERDAWDLSDGTERAHPLHPLVGTEERRPVHRRVSRFLAPADGERGHHDQSAGRGAREIEPVGGGSDVRDVHTVRQWDDPSE